MSKNLLATILTTKRLRQLAGDRSFTRGRDYFKHGQVAQLTERNNVIHASVHGSKPYTVKLWGERGTLAYHCTCPVGADGELCKHCVAVGLAWEYKLNEDETPSSQSKKSGTQEISIDDVRTYLAGKKKSVLIDLIMERVEEDDRLRERLFIKVAKQGKKGLNVHAFRRSIDRAVDGDGFVDYHSAYDYAQGIENVVDSIAELLQEGLATEVIDLSEYALRAVEESLHAIDDSDGYMGDILDRLQELHHQACQVAQPDPETLATRLLEWELRTDWDTFYGAAEIYGDVLGEKGLARYRMLAKEHWAHVSPLKPGDPDRFTDSPRFRLTHIMEMLAKQSGDLDALVAIKTKDLSHAYNYLQIAELYQQAQQYDLALEWAERGIRAFPKNTDSRLRTFLAQEYHRRARHDDALSLIWDEFSDFPHLDRYKLLKTHADKTGQWPSWREKALALVRTRLSEAKRKRTSTTMELGEYWEPLGSRHDFSLGKDIEAAWKEAKAGGCSSTLWLKLAAQRKNDHPEDAIEVYRNQIEPTLARKNNDAYQETITYLKQIHRLMHATNQQQEFIKYIQTLRLAHKPKRNFIKLLDEQQWV